MKPRPPRRRKMPAQDVVPPEVPEVSGAMRTETVAPDEDADPIPEHIRRMLEAAYT